MSEWKMPEWMREILLECDYDPSMSEHIINTPSHSAHAVEKTRIDFLVELRVAELFQTKAERDAKEKRIKELEAEIDELKFKLLDNILEKANATHETGDPERGRQWKG